MLVVPSQKKIVDAAMLTQCGEALQNIYDEMFLLDFSCGALRTIFYTPGRLLFAQQQDAAAFAPQQMLASYVHPDDQAQFYRFFQRDQLQQLQSRAASKCVLQFRHKEKEGAYIWMEVTAMAVPSLGDMRVLCCVRDVDEQKQAEHANAVLQRENEALARAFSNIYLTIVELDLRSEQASVIKSSSHMGMQGAQQPWMQLLRYYCNRHIQLEDFQQVLETFSTKALRQMLKSGRRSRTLEARCRFDSDLYAWVELSVVAIGPPEEQKLLLTSRDIHEQRLLRSIVDRFVYQNCDYFVYLDARRNSYVMISENDKLTPVLPPSSGDYWAEVEAFAHRYVAPEDRETYLREMSLTHVMEVLEHQSDHTFFFGMIDPERGYSRKRQQFMYYDKANAMLLLTRIDVTRIYLDEQKRSNQLREALQQARTDALTTLFNYRTIGDLITSALQANRHAQSALLFIDLDNFKQVNDTLGHLEGDKLLQRFAEALRRTVRPRDLVGRAGGDEFIVYLLDIPAHEHVAQCAARLLDVVAQLRDARLDALEVSCSIGIALYPQDGTEYRELVDKADKALYYAKAMGKKRFAFYSKEMRCHSQGSMVTAIDSQR